MSKDYIIDNGRIRGCLSNYAKMNVFEYWYYAMFHWRFHSQVFKDMNKSFTEIVQGIIYIFVNIIALPFYPFITLIRGYIKIKDAKIRMKEIEKENL